MATTKTYIEYPISDSEVSFLGCHGTLMNPAHVHPRFDVYAKFWKQQNMFT